MITEDDLAWSSDHLKLITKSFEVLDGTPYVPGLLRYEMRETDDPQLYLTDAGLCCQPIIEELALINQSWYFVPHSSYQGSALAPRRDVKDQIAREQNSWAPPVSPKVTISSGHREQWSSFWFYERRKKIIPLDTTLARQYMIHHTSNLYATCARGNTAFLPPIDEVITEALRLVNATLKRSLLPAPRGSRCICKEKDGFKFSFGQDGGCVAKQLRLEKCQLTCSSF
jgi:hypothetical protein